MRVQAAELEHDPQLGDLLDRLCAGQLDALRVRGALPAALVSSACARLAASEPAWQRPNRGFDGIDLRVLGAYAAPCATAPRGLTPDQYQAHDLAERDAVDRVLGDAVEADALFARLLGRLSSTGPARRPSPAEGPAFAPCNLRLLPPGQGLPTHHDGHYDLPLYAPLRAQVRASVALSFFAVLQAAERGGELRVHDLRAGRDALPRLPDGRIDAALAEARAPAIAIEAEAGDLIVFDSSHLHQVTPVEGERARVTIGGFLAPAADGRGVLYWG